jgi:hypothetical protein
MVRDIVLFLLHASLLGELVRVELLLLLARAGLQGRGGAAFPQLVDSTDRVDGGMQRAARVEVLLDDR